MRNKGFTLIELSIVLVIIGLLVGGVMGGQVLVQQARLQKLGNSLSQYKRIVDTFKMQYNALPGDMPNASDFWTGAPTGNGDGQIAYSTATTNAEDLGFWRHLSLAGLANGNFTAGVATPTRYTPNTNCPSTAVGGCPMALYPIAAESPYGVRKNYLMIGTVNSTSGNPTNSILTVQDHLSLNNKFDNGAPDSGNILAARGAEATTGCVSADAFASTSATYSYTDTTTSCRLYYKLD